MLEAPTRRAEASAPCRVVTRNELSAQRQEPARADRWRGARQVEPLPVGLGDCERVGMRRVMPTAAYAEAAPDARCYRMARAEQTGHSVHACVHASHAQLRHACHA